MYMETIANKGSICNYEEKKDYLVHGQVLKKRVKGPTSYQSQKFQMD